MRDETKQIVDYVDRQGYKPLRPKALAKKLGITKKRLGKFESALELLIKDQRVRLLDSGRVAARTPQGLVLGVMKKTASGAGFLIPHEPRPQDLVGDVYVDRQDMQDAQSGDEVLVRLISRRRSGGQRCGVIVDIVERATNDFVGSYFEDQGAGWVRIDGSNFNEPIWVGDPGAKGAQEGDKVVIEMVRFPSHGVTGEAVLTKVLGPRGEVGVDTLTVIHEFGLPVEFPQSVQEEARIEAENFSDALLDGREDLTAETVVTIDPADARDFDDAISLTRSEDGHWHLGVHIADVSHFVQSGSALDREAELRGTSVYLPTQVIPMLPEVISNGLASLQQKRLRYTKSVFIEYTADGIPVHTRLANTAIRVTQRFAYEQVLPIIRGSADKHVRVSTKVRDLLTRMHELAMLLRRRRFSKGALELDMPEVRLDFDDDGKVTGAHEREHDESHQIIEEFMLAANIAVATELTDRGLPFLRRVHGEPSPVKLQALSDFVKSMGFRLPNPQSRKDLQALLDEVQGAPEQQAINYAVLRSMKQAEYSPIDEGHFALAEPDYCHFTSPIRRYPDLLVHRLIDAIVTKRKSYAGAAPTELVRQGRHCSSTERRAERAERELTQIKLLSYLESRVGEVMQAVITGVDRFGFFCRGVALPAEGLVHISTLPRHDQYDHDRATMTIIARRSGEVFRLGDLVQVEVALVDVDRRELNFRFLRHLAEPRRKGGPRARGTPDGARKQTKKKSSRTTGRKPSRTSDTPSSRSRKKRRGR